jgi:hypothetical protein
MDTFNPIKARREKLAVITINYLKLLTQHTGYMGNLEHSLIWNNPLWEKPGGENTLFLNDLAEIV